MTMTMTAERLAVRKEHLTATDLPAILGLNPWRTPADVWAEKVWETDPSPTNDAMDIGNRLENSVLDWCADQIGIPGLFRDVFRICPDPLFSATFDALVAPPRPQDDPREAIEAKTSGIIRGYVTREEWGDPGTDQIPQMYLVQCQTQILVAGLERVYVPALLGGRGFSLYVVEPNPAIMEMITEEGHKWWEKYVVAETPPPGEPPSEDLLKRVIRQPVTVDVPQGLVAEWLHHKDTAKEAADREATAKAAVIAALGNAEAGAYDGGLVTYRQQSGGKRLDSKKFLAEHAELAALAATYFTESRFPVLRHKAAK